MEYKNRMKRIRIIVFLVPGVLLCISLLLFPHKIVISKSTEHPDKSTFFDKAPGTSSAGNYAVNFIPGLVEKDQVAKAGLLYDAEKNEVVWTKQADSSFAVASLTKMMTALLVTEDVMSKKISWDTPVTVTKEASRISSSKVYLSPGEVFTVYDLLKSSLIASANDACFLLTQHLGGTEKDFVLRMNQRAFELGMKNTGFCNSTGLPARFGERDNYSSPHDLLLLTKEILKYPVILEISRKDGEYIREGAAKFDLKNHNKLALKYSEVDGLKTGFTFKASFCIVATALRAGHRLVAIVLGSPTQAARNNFVANMLSNYYGNVLCLGRLGQPVTGDTSSVKINKSSN